MYFRFPLILLFLLVCLVAFVLLQSRFGSHIPEAKGMPSHGAADLQLAREEALLTIRATDLRAHLEFLADDLLEGRDTGSHGAAVAASMFRERLQWWSAASPHQTMKRFLKANNVRVKAAPEQNARGRGRRALLQ